MIGIRHSHRAGLIASPARIRHFITPLATFLASDIGLGATAATIGAGALEGAAVGGGLSAIQGKNPLTGALVGGLTGGAAEGVAGALGMSPTMDSLGGANGAAATAAGNAPVIAAGSPDAAQMAAEYAAQGGVPSAMGAGTSGALGSASLGNATIAGAAPSGVDAVGGSGGVVGGGSLNPLSNQAASTGKSILGSIFGNGNGSGNGGPSNGALAVGALSALSNLSKPKIGTWATPGPNSVTQSPTFNQPLNSSVPGRTAVTPQIAGPTARSPLAYSGYGGPEQNYFTGNTLANYGFAHGGSPRGMPPRGGALSHEFSTAGGVHHVEGAGDGQSDSIPAQLSDGEFVFDATTVSRIGNGSNRRGAEKLDQMRHAIAHDAGSDRVVQKKITKGPLHYLAEVR